MTGNNEWKIQLLMFWLVEKRAMTCLIWHLKILETFAFQAKPNSIDKRNRNKKLNVIKNVKEGKVYNV